LVTRQGLAQIRFNSPIHEFRGAQARHLAQQLRECRRPPIWTEREAFGASVRQREEVIHDEQGIAPHALFGALRASGAPSSSPTAGTRGARFAYHHEGDFLKPFTGKKWQTFAEGHNRFILSIELI
jgi:hypothetical protein